MKYRIFLTSVILCATLSNASCLASGFAPILRSEGPLAASTDTDTINVLGTDFTVANDVNVIIDGESIGYGLGALSMIPHDASISIQTFSAEFNGPVTSVRMNSRDAYVPGSSIVMITAIVKWVRPSLALMQVGKTSVDFSRVLSAHPELSPQPGDVMQVIGTKPSSNSPVLAIDATVTTAIKASTRQSSQLGIAGSAVISTGISGSGVVSTGISGSGAKATNRPATSLGISGSGVISTGISGSGVISTGISGSGAKATNRPATSIGISGSGVKPEGQ